MASLFRKKFQKFQKVQSRTTSGSRTPETPTLQSNPIRINTLAFTHDNKHVISINGNLLVSKWNMVSQAEKWELDASYVTPMSCAAISPDGSLAAVGSDTGVVVAWDLENIVVRYAFRSHRSCVTSVQFSPDSSILASTSSNGTMILWDMNTSRQIRKYNTGPSSRDFVLAFRDSLFATNSSDSSIKLWDVSHYSAQPRLILSGHTESVNAVAFSPDGNRLISGSDDTTIRLWGLDAEETYAILKSHTKKVTIVTFSRGASIIVSGSEDRTVRVWDASNATLMHTLQGHTTTISAIMFSPSGLVLASQSINDEVRVWDKKTWKMLSTSSRSGDERPD
jgi:WD40 repeat protein